MTVRRAVAALLLVWEPLTLAIAASASLQSLIDRGPASVAFLVVRLAVTGIGMAAGARLWQHRAGGVVLARWSYALQLVTTLVAGTTRLWPATLPPGLAGPAFAAGLAWYLIWFWWSLRAVDPAD